MIDIIKNELTNRVNNIVVHPVAFTSDMTSEEKRELLRDLWENSKVINKKEENKNAPR
ncbi:hypothetical protein QTV49_000357 [Vibrio vulnificus]|nr:hypothetical protein [Vibrio vulnificus]